MGQGANGGNGNCTWRVQQIIREWSSDHEVPNFPSLLGHTHSEVGWPFLQSH